MMLSITVAASIDDLSKTLHKVPDFIKVTFKGMHKSP